MTTSVARRVVLTSTLGLAASLLVVGLATGVLLHVRALRALDQTLLAVAHARAGSTTEIAWTREHHPEIETWLVTAADDRIPFRIRERAARGPEPLIKDMGDDRLVLVPKDVDGTPVLAAALAPRVTVPRSVGAFATVWLAASVATLLAASAVIRGAVLRAFRPLDRAREDVARVVELGQGQRVPSEAPVEIEALLSAVNALLDRLDASHALQIRFVADAAHELRTPVTALQGTLDVVLRRDRTTEELRDALVSARDDVGRLRGLVEALTALARVDAGEVEAHRDIVRAADLAEQVLEGERHALEAAGCTVAFHADDDPELEVNRVLLELALRNLLRNAARHAPGSAVTLTVRTEGDRAVFEVRDTGPGIDPDRAEAVFERFARGPDAQANDPTGLGLGLPLAREVAKRHGGDCVLKPLPTGGTRAVLDVRVDRARKA